MAELLFKNKDILNWKSNFTPRVNSKAKSKPRVYTQFHLGKTTQFRGLNLCEYIRGEKHFVILFRLKGKRNQRIFNLGKFDLTQDVITGETKFGVKQCQERLFKIAKEHQDEYGKWVKDPSLTIAFSSINQSVTIRKLIEEYAKQGFEKMKNAEKIRGNSIRDKVRYMFGYNLRTKHFEYDDHDNGDGFVRFVPSKNLKTKTGEIKNINKPAPKDWDELFKWYPPGKHILKDHQFNLHGLKSIYDHDIGKINIEELRTKLMVDYIHQYNSFSTKKDVLECFRSLWHFAVHKGYMENDAMLNPTYLVPIKKGRATVNKYKLKIFSETEWELLLQVCNDLSSRFPWQADGIVLEALTGLRKEEAWKLKKTDIKYFSQPKVYEGKNIYGEIHIRPSVSKMGIEEFIPINEPIKDCLDNIKKIPEQHFTYHSKLFNLSHRNYALAYAKKLPWLFCTTQIRETRMFDVEYRKSKKTRLRSNKHCWDEIKVEMKKRLGLGIRDELLCTGKMLRKTYTHMAKAAFGGRSDIAKRFTRHKSEAVLESLYDGTTREEVYKNSTQLAKVLNFVKRRA